MINFNSSIINDKAHTKRVLIYGDSNTWGYTPITGVRYSKEERWAGLIAPMLGSGFEVIEQGLPGRTAGDIDAEKPFKNGLEHFLSSALSQYPFDLLVISLGTNDFKSEFSRTPEQILADLVEYNELLKEHKINCQLLFVTPSQFHLPIIFDQAKEKAIELAKLFSVTSFNYLDMSSFEPNGADRVHMTKDDHIRFAKLVYERINSFRVI